MMPPSETSIKNIFKAKENVLSSSTATCLRFLKVEKSTEAVPNVIVYKLFALETSFIPVVLN